MKKLLSLAVASFAFAAMADYTGQTIGVTKITTTNKNTIVAVPFTSLTNSVADISANDLVSTVGLPAETQLQVFKNNQYYGWQLDQNDGWVAVGDQVASSADVIANSTVACGGAIWVVLKNVPATAQDIYIYGDFSEPTTESSIAADHANLIANPLQSDATFALTGAPVKGDMIIIPSDGSAESYSYGRGGWVNNGNSIDLASITVKVGQGFWYVSKSTSGVSKIIWSAKSN